MDVPSFLSGCADLNRGHHGPELYAAREQKWTSASFRQTGDFAPATYLGTKERESQLGPFHHFPTCPGTGITPGFFDGYATQAV